MNTYNVVISPSANADIIELAEFLRQMMSLDGARRYLKVMLNEIQSLSILADLYRPSHYIDIIHYHPKARRMVSHNKRWTYIFHIEDDTVVVDRIRPAKMITK